MGSVYVLYCGNKCKRRFLKNGQAQLDEFFPSLWIEFGSFPFAWETGIPNCVYAKLEVSVTLGLVSEEATNWNCNNITKYVVTAPAREYSSVESRVKNPDVVNWSL